MSLKNNSHHRESTTIEPNEIDCYRQLCYKSIIKGFQEKNPVLIEALPAMGKSSGVIWWAANHGTKLTVLTARHELYGQFGKWCDDWDLTWERLPSFHHDCPTANGTHGDRWKNELCDKYRQGLSGAFLHKHGSEIFGEILPCRREGGCNYLAAREFDPAEYDVLIGHYRHAHVTDWIEERYVALDEFPDDDYLTSFKAEVANRAVSEYLANEDGLPFDNCNVFIEDRKNAELKHQAKSWFLENNSDLDTDVGDVIDNRSTHAHVRSAELTYALLVGKRLNNGWEFSKLPTGKTVVRNPKSGTLTLLNPPQLDAATSVIGLDGTPTVEKWRLILGHDLIHQPVLTEDEKREYLKDTLGIEIIQISPDAHYYSGASGIGITPARDMALLREISKREEQTPDLITTKSALHHYDSSKLSEVVSNTAYFGDFKGSNEFANTRLGAVFGSPHYGDEYIQRWAALADESVERVDGTKGMGQDFGELGNSILRGMRENEVLQAIMRFGRDGNGTRVYVNSAAIPNWVEPTIDIPEIHCWQSSKEGMKQVINALRNREDWPYRECPTPELYDEVTISNEQVRTNLKTLEKYGYIEGDRSNRPYLWKNIRLNQAQEYGHVEFSSASKG